MKIDSEEIYRFLVDARGTHYDQHCLYCGVRRHPVLGDEPHQSPCPLLHRENGLEAIRALWARFVWETHAANGARAGLGLARDTNVLHIQKALDALHYRLKNET